MKKSWIVALGLCALAALASCSGGGGSKTQTAEGKQLVIQIGSNLETMDPALVAAEDAGNYILFTFERLLSLDEHNQVQAGAAESWESSEDGLEWTFHLREGLKWSDGSDLTAEDFVYSWQRLADPDTAAPYGETVLATVEGYKEAIGNPDANGNPTTDPDPSKLGIEAVDARTLRIRLSHFTPYFEKLMAFETLSPVQCATVEANGDSWATSPATYISNGPFYLSDWVPSSYITFSKNPYYWNADAIKLDSIKCLLMEDSNASYSAYQTGAALLVRDVPTEELSVLKTHSDFYTSPRLATSYTSFNLSRPAFSDVRVRQALSLAVDRKYIAEVILAGISTPGTNLVSRGVSDWDGSEFKDKANGGRPYIDADNYEADLERAKELMAEAGYPNGHGYPIISYTTNDAGANTAVAEYLQQAWAQLGVTLNVETVEWASFAPKRRAGDYDTARNGWNLDYDDPVNILELFYSTNGNNDGKYNNSAFDALIDRSREETDPEKRFAILHEAEDLLMDDAAMIPMLWSTTYFLASPKISGWWYTPSGRFYLQYADISE